MKPYVIILLLLCSCTPAEVQIAEGVVHEAEVAEEAVMNDMERSAYQKQYSHDVPPGDPPQCSSNSIKNHRQYPNRRPNRVTREEQGNYGP